MNMTSQIDQYRIDYTNTINREEKAESYINDPLRTQDEIEKWTPEYKALIQHADYLLMMIGHYTPDNIISGWPELLEPINRPAKKEVPTEILKEMRLF